MPLDNALVLGNLCEHAISDISLKTRFFGLHFHSVYLIGHVQIDASISCRPSSSGNVALEVEGTVGWSNFVKTPVVPLLKNVITVCCGHGARVMLWPLLALWVDDILQCFSWMLEMSSSL